MANTTTFVTFNPDKGPSVTVGVDAQTPVLTGGFGGWETVDRPRRTSMVRYKGRTPFTQDISIMFDGWIDGISQESDIRNLERMAVQPKPLEEPAKIRLAGMALRKDLTWVIDSLDYDTDKTIWDDVGKGPVRLRQAMVVHLTQFIDDAILVTAATPAIINAKPTKRRVVHGITLRALAQEEYGDPDGWQEIWMANVWLDNSPRAIIPNGTRVTIPAWHGHPFSVVIIGKNA
jgi:nucleoid-associated protein YgaU